MEARQSKLAKKVLSELHEQGKARDFMKYVRKAGQKYRGGSVEYDHNGKRYSIKKL